MHWGLLLTASAMLMLTMGVRQTTGLFMAPIHESTGIGIAKIGLALTIRLSPLRNLCFLQKAVFFGL